MVFFLLFACGDDPTTDVTTTDTTTDSPTVPPTDVPATDVPPTTDTTDVPDGDGDGDGFPDGVDCDDTNDRIHPDAIEICDKDNIDQDCNGLADDLDPGVDASTFSPWYPDMDGDGAGAQGAPPVGACDPVGEATADNNGDCRDDQPAINPGASEVCDNLDADNDCNGLAEDMDPGVRPESFVSWYPDLDDDGAGDTYGVPTLQCERPSPDTIDNSADCNDANPNIHLFAPEVCDPGSTDEDCDGLANEADPDTGADCL